MSVYKTDGTFFGLGKPRTYKVICEYNGYSWVEASDGTMRTFSTRQLKEVPEK